MSKEKTPEVGDVWEYQDKLYHVSAITDKVVEVWCKSSNDIMRKHNWVISGFITVFNYLGKSKVNIKELFDVAED
jgi:hypothetical protein